MEPNKGQITGGTVRIEETKQIADYQPRKVVVELNFAAVDSQSAEAILDHAASIAQDKVRELLGQKVPSAKPSTDVRPGAPTRTKADLEREQAEALAKPTAPLPKPPRKAASKAAPADDLPDVEPAPAEENLDDLMNAAPPVEEITDAVMLSKVTAHVQKFKNAPAIRALTATFFKEPVGKRIQDIPQDKRASYLAGLEKIGAP